MTHGLIRSDARKRAEMLTGNPDRAVAHGNCTVAMEDIWDEVLEEASRKRREHVIPKSGKTPQRNDTARTVAVPAHTILATISLRDDVARERAE